MRVRSVRVVTLHHTRRLPRETKPKALVILARSEPNRGIAGDLLSTHGNECGPGLTCDALSRCSPAACDKASPCPITFVCNAGRCATRTCTTTADCPGSFCLDGRCGAEQGRCYQSDIICGRPLITELGVQVALLERGLGSGWSR